MTEPEAHKLAEAAFAACIRAVKKYPSLDSTEAKGYVIDAICRAIMKKANSR
jgi:hypothetical protein